MKFLLARIFGKRIISIAPPCGEDFGCKIKARWYKGIMYITKVEYF